MLITIAGGSGSGKTTLTNKIIQEFPNQVALVHCDDFYKEQFNCTYEERARVNYDHPDSYDNELLREKLKELKKGNSVTIPVYNFSIHNRSDKTQVIEAKKIIILDGILSLYDEEIRKLSDIKIFVDVDADVRIIRRIIRDVQERGRSIESVTKQYLETVKPMHELYIEPTKQFADIIMNDVLNEKEQNKILKLIEERASLS
ncbi:MAG: uridine kinase [Treponema sp.]|nr:uridine kinase [Treponema sp.]